MSFTYRLGLLGLCLFLFQNCGSFDSKELNIVYSYQSKPEFFYDLKLIRMDKDELGRETFEFDIAVSRANSTVEAVNFFVAYSTLARSSSCPTQEFHVEGNTKHRRFSCKIPVSDEFFIQLTFLNPRGENVVQEYRF